MKLADYRRKKNERMAAEPTYRSLCTNCIQPEFGCYCKTITPISCPINFVILIHPIEAKRRIATGRMAHLCLEGSHLVKGQNYTDHQQIDQLIADSEYHSVILYPGLQSQNLTLMTEQDRAQTFLNGKKLRIFVIDGTWATAAKMLHQSANLKKLSRISFTPTNPSNFRVRKQPEPHCYSTIEAIHHTINLFSDSKNLHRPHDHLLQVFDSMVEKQLSFLKEVKLNLRQASYRRDGQNKVS